MAHLYVPGTVLDSGDSSMNKNVPLPSRISWSYKTT